MAFLVLLRHSLQGGKVFLLNGRDLDHVPAEMGLNLLDVPLIKPQKVTFDIDVVIEMGA